MNFLKRIDDEILSFFTKISHKFQRLTGRTSFFLAKCCLVIMGFSIVVDMGNSIIPLLNKRTDILLFIIQIVWAYGISKDLNNCTKTENNILDEEKAKVPFELAWPAIGRLLFGVGVLILGGPEFFGVLIGMTKSKISWVLEIASKNFFPALVAFSYFVTVNPLPPGKSKIREWLGSFGKIPVPIPVRNK